MIDAALRAYEALESLIYDVDNAKTLPVAWSADALIAEDAILRRCNDITSLIREYRDALEAQGFADDDNGEHRLSKAQLGLAS